MKRDQKAVSAQAVKSRDILFRDFAVAAVGMLAFQAVLFYSGTMSWDYCVRVESALALPLAAGALLCILWMNVLLWRLKSLTGDRDLRRYWIYCLAMAALCWICRDLDGGGDIPLIAAVFSTPMGPVGALTAVLMDGARYETCCGACLAFLPGGGAVPPLAAAPPQGGAGEERNIREEGAL